jgi:hypothetical protein
MGEVYLAQDTDLGFVQRVVTKSTQWPNCTRPIKDRGHSLVWLKVDWQLDPFCDGPRFDAPLWRVGLNSGFEESQDYAQANKKTGLVVSDARHCGDALFDCRAVYLCGHLHSL